ncbi:hypothetical protein O6R08_10850 [Cutibacterium equinum]|uniref:Lipoprotein n=1 Tax=Cutibacterium equinum TaxID=3016342 RepID=A0ABY7QZF9_9ACTN|nr:hypothetical protein [Cutibacterium equinum]WCC79924.1 hypothetical protein O6R08_10850 [Cutibacterium equinum]
MKVAVLGVVATTSLSLAACDGGSKADDRSDKPAASDPLFKKGKVDEERFAKEVKASMSKVKTYRQEISAVSSMGGMKIDMKVTGDYDGTDSSKPKAHMTATGTTGNHEQMIIGDEAFTKEGSAWKKDQGPSQTDTHDVEPGKMADGLTRGIDDLTYVGKESGGHRYDGSYNPPADSTSSESSNASPSAGKAKSTGKVTFWLDDSKRIKRMKASVASEEGGDMKVDAAFSKYDEKMEFPKVP